MRKTVLLLTIVAVLTGLVVLPAAAQDDADDAPTIAATVVQSANAESPEFTTLLAALETAQLVPLLDETGPFTVFAPTDAAFARELEAAGLTADEVLNDEELLLQTLLLHIVPGTFTAETVATLDGQQVASAYWQSTLSIAVGDDGVTVNEQPVVQTDIIASNGVIHVIDGLLLPGDAGSLSGGLLEGDASLAETAVAASVAEEDAEFVTLVAAVEAAGLVEALSTGGPYTVFAPTDAAFAALLDGLGITADDLLADTALLTEVLSYHVVPLNYFAADLAQLDGALVGTLLNDTALTIAATEDGVTVNGVNVVGADVVANNGVIHVIDTVLIPPADTDPEEADTEDADTEDADTTADDTDTADTTEDAAGEDDTADAEGEGDATD